MALVALVALAATGEAEALAIHLEDVDVVGQPVEQGAGEAFGSEHRCPFIEGQIAGDQRAARHSQSNLHGSKRLR